MFIVITYGLTKVDSTVQKNQKLELTHEIIEKQNEEAASPQRKTMLKKKQINLNKTRY